MFNFIYSFKKRLLQSNVKHKKKNYELNRKKAVKMHKAYRSAVFIAKHQDLGAFYLVQNKTITEHRQTHINAHTCAHLFT